MNILFQEAIQFADNTTLLNTGVGGGRRREFHLLLF